MNKDKYIYALTELVKKIPTIDDNIDEIFEPLKDYTDTLGDLISPVKMVLTTLNVANEIKFKKFIKRLALKIDEGRITDEYIQKLEEYLKKEANLEYVAEIIDSSIKAKSSKCSAIMGYYAGGILNELRMIQYKDTVVLNALSLLNNIDLKNFIFIFDNYANIEKKRFRVHEMREELESKGVISFELENTIEKLKSVQVLGYDVGGMSNIGNAWGGFLFNENSHYFYGIIKKSRVMDILEQE